MNRKWITALAWAPLAVVCAVPYLSGTGHAADHLDGPAATKDPAADITDVYAFTSPQTAGHLVLVMNVFPLATSSAKFSDKVEYWFRIREITGTSPVTLGTAALDVKCTVDGTPMKMTCAGPGGLTKTAEVSKVEGATTDDIRVFAGLRSDPFFFDLDKFKKTVADNAPAFTMPGKNFFDKANVMSIVVEMDATKAFGKAGAIVTVAAETKRTGN